MRTISGQLSLWDQKGSKVTRGNLIVIPIEDSFMYVEPVYLTAEGTNLPQLKRIIVVSGDKVVMEPTLNGALNALFGTQQPQERAAQAPSRQPELGQARAQFEEAEKAIQQGDWKKFGKAMDALKRLLTEPPRLSSGSGLAPERSGRFRKMNPTNKQTRTLQAAQAKG